MKMFDAFTSEATSALTDSFQSVNYSIIDKRNGFIAK